LTDKNINLVRVHNQQILGGKIHDPGSLVHWLGAVQAQDYQGAKWSLGLRLKGLTDTDIEQSISDRKIIRTWAMRGTLHFVSPRDIHRMLQLIAPKVMKSSAARHRQLGITNKILSRSSDLILKALENGHALTRKEISDLLNKHGIATNENRLSHILVKIVMDRMICFGPRRDKEFTFVALNYWVPEAKKFSRDESLAMLAERYFTSHGPAALQDYIWWSGLTVGEARAGLEMIKNNLTEIPSNGKSYWMNKESLDIPENKHPGKVSLLPGFDEYIIGYKDRSSMIPTKFQPRIFGASKNGILANTIIYNGQAIGTWKRVIVKSEVHLHFNPFKPFTKAQLKGIQQAGNDFGNFMGKRVFIQPDADA
jgi:hypothetical protein